MVFKIIFLLLCASVFSISNETGDLDWWQNTILYQVYPRSFKDSDGDGLGDLKGIEEKADYFKWLGVGAIWLNPIFASPMVDFGYDISNYIRLDPTFGTTDDLKSLVKKLKEIGVKLILDFVPNHTSSEHEWFKKSVEKIEPYTDYYIWKDPKEWVNGEPVPPNNWISAFNVVPAWSFNEKRGQFYLHHFHRLMPDLNYKNEHVLKEMENVLRFWLDAGVDGLRFDAVPYLIEDENFPDEAYIDPNGAKNDYFNMIHNYTKDQPGTYEILRNWRILMDNYTNDDQSTGTRLVLTEAYTDLNKTMMYYGTEEEPIAHIPFNFELIVKLSPHSNSKEFVKVVNDWIDSMPPGKWPNWVIGNHDRKRVASLFGAEMVDVLNIMVTLLPGTCVNYYGDELGMQNAFIRWDQTKDPQGIVLGKDKYETGSRDGCRTPMPWDNTMNGGFSTRNETWLPVNPDYWHLNLMAEKQVADSHVNIYRKLAASRKLPTLQKGEFKIYTPDNWTIVFTRTLENHPSFVIVLNIGSELLYPDVTSVPGVPTDLYVYTASSNSVYRSGDKIQVTPESIQMRPKSAVVLTTDSAVVTNADIELGLSSIKDDDAMTLNCQPIQNKGTCQPINEQLLYHERCN